MPQYELVVNGTSRTVDAPANMPLLWVLRDLLQLTGTHYGCGMALCRACTVHVDGVARVSCQFPVSAAAGKRITTIEGLGEGGLHRVQQAWIDHEVPQCGLCQPGQIMGAAALLAANPTPDDAAIEAAMAGHVCRCGTYNRVRAAIRSLAREGT